MAAVGSSIATGIPVPERPNTVILPPLSDRRTSVAAQNSLSTIATECSLFRDFEPVPETNQEVEEEGSKKRPTAAVRPHRIQLPLFRSPDQFDAEKMKEKRRQWRKMLKELGKHFGFLSLLLAYTALGGGIFWQLEAKFDQKIRKEIENDLKSHLRHWCQILENSKPIDVCVEILLNQLNFNASLMLPKELKANSMPWDFMHAMFFASTVYSTIGYGNIVPRTVLGKLATMIYGTIGIPLMLVVMSDLGGFLKSCVQMFWSKMKKCARSWFTNKVHADNFSQIFRFEDYDFVPLPIWFAVLLLYLYMLFSAGILMLFEPDWDYMTGLWFSFVTFATIGFGDEFPKNPNYIFASFLFVVFGLSMVSMCLTTIKDYIRRRYAQAAAQQEIARKFVAKWKELVERGKMADHQSI